MKIKYVTIFLVLLCCFIGAASAAEDVSTDIVSDSIDDVAIDAVQEEIGEIPVDTVTTEPTVSDDTIIEEIDEDIKADEISEESAIVDSEQTRASSVTVTSWSELSTACSQSSAQTIYLSGAINATNQITIKNSATIIGSPSSYITGGSSTVPFYCSKSTLTTVFRNIQFKNMNVVHLCQLSGTNIFENCTFNNITTGTGKNSVLYNTYGFMNVSNCNFTNCSTGYGTITNYNLFSTTAVTMSVSGCKFENNTAISEPGAINNCGILNVTNSEFNYNTAGLWAGAIHTHTNAKTFIKHSLFKGNLAGWNGGALYTYSTLDVYNSTFIGNNCTTDSGGGAIGAYSYGSTYNVTIDSCNFINNTNMATNGRGGAIGTLNAGNLTVCYSNFTNNHADVGQAIAAVTYTIQYCINCTNCNCSNCPNCTNCTHNVSNGTPHLQIFNNTFENHTGSEDTVVISGNDYLFENNTFINSVQIVHYNGGGNDYGSKITLNMPISSLSNPILKSSNILSNTEDFIEKYVSSTMELITACSELDSEHNYNIYLANGVYSLIDGFDSIYPWCQNIVNFIGESRENTIISIPFIPDCNPGKTTFINLTFYNLEANTDSTFINCTILGNLGIQHKLTEDFYYEDFEAWDPEYKRYGGGEKTYIVQFENCDFRNLNTEDAPITVYQFGRAEFNSCTFENITANSVVFKHLDFWGDDGIYFSECIFKNLNVKGIVDIPAGTVIGVVDDSRVIIEDCIYDSVVSTEVVPDGDRAYVNSTGSRTATVLNAIVDINDNLVISLKDANENILANVDVLISVNGGDATPYQLESDGTLSIPLTDLSSSLGPISITVSFEKTSDYKASTATVDYVIRNATSIVAEDLTTEVNVAKDLTVTLLDNNGNPLAGKDIIVSVGGVNSTKTTDENGVAVILVNYDTAGVYEYTLSFDGDDATYKESTKVVTVTVKESAPVTPEKVATKITAPKVSAVYNVAKKLVITLTDKDGKALANKKVTVKVGTISKTLTTNAKGQVSLNVATLVPKTYTATVKFAGDDAYLASSESPKVVVSKAKPQIVAKAKTFKVKVKTKKYTVTLKNNKGKVMKKVKLTLKVGKKTYKATTNTKGKAIFKITKLTKKGKYTATVKFAGNKYYKALSKKVKITVKK